MLRKIRVQGPWLVVSAIVLGLLISSFAVAAGEGRSILGGKRNPAGGNLTSETQIIAANGTYGTRQSNKSDNGGGAIYGCRSTAGGSEKGRNPCIRSNNLAGGRAFEFQSSGGPEVGTITSGNVNAAPFTTNAKGVATGLNADQVDGKSADDIKNETLAQAKTDAVTAAQGLTLLASVGGDGALGTVKRGATASARTSDGNYTVTFDRDISACAIQATQTTVTNAGAVSVQLQDDKKTVAVRTRAGGGADGTGTPDVTDRPFNLTVSC